MFAARGVIVVPAAAAAIQDATLRVRILDVSRADAAAVTLAESTVRGVAIQAGREAALPFALTADPPVAIASATVSAHLDLTGDGRVKAGDYVTVQSYPVDGDPAAAMRVHIRRVE